MIEGLTGRGTRLCHAMQREVVGTRREVDVVGIRLPLDREAEEIHVETLHSLEVSRVEREMPEARVFRPIHFPKAIVNGKLTHAPQVDRQVAVCALRRQGHLRTEGRGEVLPRLLGQEDRRRRNRRPRICAETLYPRTQRREVPDLSLDAQAPMRPADRRGRWIRSVPDVDALPQLRLG